MKKAEDLGLTIGKPARRGTLDRRTLLRNTALATGGIMGAGLLAACQPQSGTGPAAVASGAAPRRGGTLVVGIRGAIRTLDPGAGGGPIDGPLEQQLFEGPLRFKPDSFEMEPAIAEGVDVSSDGLTYTIRLRPNLTFHDGTKLDAAAYKFGLDRQAFSTDPLYKQLTGSAWAELAGGNPGAFTAIETTDALTVRLRLKNPVANVINFMANVNFMAVNPVNLRRDIEGWAKNPVGAGSGPFVFEELIPDQRVSFRRFDNYWQQGRPYIDRLIFLFKQDVGSRVLAIKTGEVQVIQVAGPEIGELQNDPNIDIRTGPPAEYAYLALNHGDPILGKKEVRQAISHALDRATILRQLWPNSVVAESIGLQPGIDADYRSDIKWYGYDVARAKQLLAQAGHPNGFPLTITYTSGAFPIPDAPAFAQAIQGELAKVGIQVTLKEVDVPTIFGGIFGLGAGHKEFPFQAAIGGIAGRGDPQKLMAQWNGISNYGGFNPEYGTAIAAAAKEPDPAKRSATYKQLQQKLYDDVWGVPFAHAKTAIAVRKNVQGLQPPIVVYPVYYKDVWLSDS